jgi:hypothetical protein
VKRIAILLRMLLIAGLAVAPLSAHAFVGGERAMTHHMTMDPTAAAMPADSAAMPCDDATMNCGDMDRGDMPCPDMQGGKACPCLAMCAAMVTLGLPSIVPVTTRVSVVSQRIAVSSEAQLASLAATPPARPPRT